MPCALSVLEREHKTSEQAAKPCLQISSGQHNSHVSIYTEGLITLKKEQKKPRNKRIVHKVLIFPKLKISLQPSDYSTTSSANF